MQIKKLKNSSKKAAVHSGWQESKFKKYRQRGVTTILVGSNSSFNLLAPSEGDIGRQRAESAQKKLSIKINCDKTR
jgi:hypothetical protein